MSNALWTLVGVLLGGVITRFYAERYFQRQNDLAARMAEEQEARAEHVFELLVRLVRGVAEGVEKEAQTHVQVIRDAKGHMTDIKVWLIHGYAPTITVTKSEEMQTKSGESDDLMS